MDNKNRLAQTLIALTTLILIMVAPVALAAPRLALIIGNAQYLQRPLTNPVNDARLIADTLKQLNFEVTLKENLRREEMFSTVQSFIRKLGKDGVGFFFYAGHAVQLDGTNYLLPVDALLKNEDDVEVWGFNANYLLNRLDESKNRINIVVLDACRDNPYATAFRSTQQGLARMEGPQGSLIAFSTGPGKLALDGKDGYSPYSRALANAMLTPDLPIEMVFKKVAQQVFESTQKKQLPWVHTSMIGDLVLLPGESGKVALPETKPVPAGKKTVVAANDKTRNATDPESVTHKKITLKPRADYATYSAKQWHALLAELERSVSVITRDEFSSLTNKAESGDAEAQTLLALLYEHGTQFVERSNPKALKWYRAAANQGFVIAQNNLGQMIGEGRGVKRDYVEAFHWIKAAAEKGYGPAQLNLGQMYLNGWGVTQDAELGRQWVEKSSAQHMNEIRETAKNVITRLR